MLLSANNKSPNLAFRSYIAMLLLVSLSLHLKSKALDEGLESL